MAILKWTIASLLVYTNGNIVTAFHHCQSRATLKRSYSKPKYDRRHQPLFSFVDIGEDAQRDIQSMEEWAYACGVQRDPGIQFTYEDALGINDGSRLDISFMTTEDIPAGSPILYVPSNMILSSHSAMEEFGQLEDVEKIIYSLNAESELRHFYLMLKILAEWEKCDQSPWYYWLNSLPRYYSNAASMTPFCFKCLPSLMASLALKERSNMNNLIGKQIPFLNDATWGNTDLWVWAYQVIVPK